jgi:hypothetical protein
MDTFQIALTQTIKHWPLRTTQNNELVRALATVFAQAGTEEVEIELICNKISDELDGAFARGQYSVLLD